MKTKKNCTVLLLAITMVLLSSMNVSASTRTWSGTGRGYYLTTVNCMYVELSGEAADPTSARGSLMYSVASQTGKVSLSNYYCRADSQMMYKTDKTSTETGVYTDRVQSKLTSGSATVNDDKTGTYDDEYPHYYYAGRVYGYAAAKTDATPSMVTYAFGSTSLE